MIMEKYSETYPIESSKEDTAASSLDVSSGKEAQDESRHVVVYREDGSVDTGSTISRIQDKLRSTETVVDPTHRKSGPDYLQGATDEYIQGRKDVLGR